MAILGLLADRHRLYVGTILSLNALDVTLNCKCVGVMTRGFLEVFLDASRLLLVWD